MKRLLRRWIDRQNYCLDTPQVELPMSRLPDSLAGARLLLLTDLHFHQMQPYHDAILQAARQAGPHGILITGDSVDGETEDFDALYAFFRILSRIAPCAAVLGNNDCAEGKTLPLREVYAKSGVTLLENESRTLQVGRGKLTLLGITDPMAFERGVSQPREENAPGCVPRASVMGGKRADGQEQITVMLLHRPELARNFLSPPPALIVCGHAHGGQFRLPGGQGLYAPGQGIFPHLTSGLYHADTALMYVSRGLGNHGFPLRLNNRPHLPLLILQKDEKCL